MLLSDFINKFKKVSPVKRAVKEAWAEGIKEEVDFWRGRVQEWGSGHGRMNRYKPIAADLEPYYQKKKNVKMLVVGSGPCSDVGYRNMDGAPKVELFLTDALAGDYEVLWKEFGFEPPIKPQKIAGEELSTFFKKDFFDLVYSVNALDHAYDPMRIIEEMLKVVKPGCYIVIEVWENEAVHAQGEGLHQWCVYESGRDLMLEQYHKPLKINVTQKIKNKCQIKVIPHFGSFLNGDRNYPEKKRIRIEIIKK